MDLLPTSDHELLRDAAREFLAQRSALQHVREQMDTDRGFDDGLWKEMAELGWLGIAIPERYGGSGSSMLEMGVVVEELGRVLTPAPFLSTVVLGAALVEWSGSEPHQSALLPAVVSGDLRLAVGLSDGAEAPAEAVVHDGEVVLTGSKSYVIDGHTADVVLVTARVPDTGSIAVVAVPQDAPGLESRRLDTLDMTRKQAEVTLDAVRLPASAVVAMDAGSLVDRLLDHAVVALAYEQVGGAQRCLEVATDHAKERHQFGRPIGSFQAIKHKCADMLVAVEGARSAAAYAGWAAATNDPDLPVAAALAKVQCSEAYFSAAAETIQVLGGIGFTWEHDAHLYFKRAKTDELLFGPPSHWRAKLAARLGL